MSESRKDLIVFHSGQALSESAVDLVRKQLREVMPGLQVVICGPGDTISMPMDTRRLYESVEALSGMVASLVKINQELLGELVNMVVDSGDQEPSVTHHLGMSHRG